MRSDAYRKFFTASLLMGPNSLRILDSLLEKYPLRLSPDNLVLDLGCGCGITSLFAARETGAIVHGFDLWIKEEDNRKRFAEWNMADRLIPVNGDANALPYSPETFEAIVSVDSYHYYGTKEGFFAEKILPVIKKGGTVLIGVPGIKNEYDGRSEELLTPWLGDEAYMFQSAQRWKEIIGAHEDIAEVDTWEMPVFDIAWQEWLDSSHEYALGDRKFFDDIIKPYTSFVGILIRKKA